MNASFGLVFRERRRVALAALLFALMSILLLWSGNVLSVTQRGVTVIPQWPFILASLSIGLLFGIVIPMQLTAFRLAATSAGATGGTVLGAIAGAASMTCCAPVILPSLLSLAGFSGVTILNLNGELHRFWLPLATVSLLSLGYSLISVAESLHLTCLVPPPFDASSRHPGRG
jgi:hypothetical protein